MGSYNRWAAPVSAHQEVAFFPPTRKWGQGAASEKARS
jgi:hypothetical protein